jgi:hypothetical protein
VPIEKYSSTRLKAENDTIIPNSSRHENESTVRHLYSVPYLVCLSHYSSLKVAIRQPSKLPSNRNLAFSMGFLNRMNPLNRMSLFVGISAHARLFADNTLSHKAWSWGSRQGWGRREVIRRYYVIRGSIYSEYRPQIC